MSDFVGSGVVSGPNTSTLIVGDSGGLAQRRIILPNPNNTFMGTIDLNDDGRRGAIYVASIGDAPGAGNIVMRGQDESRFDLDSSAQAPLTFNHRHFEIASSGTTQGYADIRNMNTASSHANTFTINTDLLVSSSGGSKESRLGGANTGTNTFAGSIPDGDGTVISVRKDDAGLWILAGTNTYTGATTVNAGHLEIGGSGVLGNGNCAGNISIASSSSGRLVYNSTATQTLSGVISGAGALFVESGTLSLDNNNTYTGATTVNGGTLQVNGSLASAVTLNGGTLLVDDSLASSSITFNGGTLGGEGTITGDVTVPAAGNLAPGSAGVGTLTISGNLNMASGLGQLFFELGPVADSDKIEVTGTLNIGSGQLGWDDFDFTNVGGLTAGTYTLIESGTLTGELAANRSGSIGSIEAVLDIVGNNVVLVVPEPNQPSVFRFR